MTNSSGYDKIIADETMELGEERHEKENSMVAVC